MLFFCLKKSSTIKTVYHAKLKRKLRFDKEILDDKDRISIDNSLVK